MNNTIFGPNGCYECGGEYGEHYSSCSILIEQLSRKNNPRRFRVRLPENKEHPNGSKSKYRYGCYFPLTDLVVGDMGSRGTGEPTDVEWLDE